MFSFVSGTVSIYTAFLSALLIGSFFIAKSLTISHTTTPFQPEYLAPEIITSKGHDKAADYWAFGVLVYEMLVGRSAFYVRGADNIALFKNIVCVKYSIPRAVNGFAQDLIKKLLVRNQATRLGNLSRGHLDIQDHPWFEKINFATIINKELKAPWIPEKKNPMEATHFEQSRAQKEFHGRPLSKKDQALFDGF